MGVGAVLRLSGAAFDVDRFVADNKSEPCAIWHQGDVRLRTRPPETENGCNVRISEADELDQQCLDVIAFFARNEPWMRKLNGYGADDPCVDFSADIPPDNVYGRFYRFPIDLIRFAGALGVAIQLSTYRVDHGPAK